MFTTAEDSLVLQKTRELCQAILEQPGFVTLRKQMDTFFSDAPTQNHYQQVVAKGEKLQQKQQMGLALTDDEVRDFESDRDALVSNPVARAYLEAQQQMHHLEHSVGKYVAKTLELGRLPTEQEMADGCGGGCSCH